MNSNHIETIAEFCRTHLNLKNAKLSESFFYHSLPLCIVDSVFSIGANYTSTKNTVTSVCKYFDLENFRPYGSLHLPRESQVGIKHFLDLFPDDDDISIAKNIFNNQQRTSSKNGILKATATLKFASVMKDHHIDKFQDLDFEKLKDIEIEIKSIPGQRSGISFSYFLMLAGDNSQIKPDRMVLRFLSQCTNSTFDSYQATEAITLVAKMLQSDYPEITPRLLDHEIWKYTKTNMAA